MPPRTSIESRLALADPRLGRLIEAVTARIGTQRIAPSRATPFEALIRAVVYQSISAAAAEPTHRRLRETISTPVTPVKVLALRSRSLTKAGVSQTKAQTIRGLAAWFAANRALARALPSLSDAEIVETLTGLPGIGAWTVNVFLIFNLGRLDVMPSADLGIRRGVQLIDGLRAVATPKQVLNRSQAWSPYRSIASIYLWQAVKLKLQPSDLVQAR
jgi:DNA-3-methyladenine glycosylase II